MTKPTQAQIEAREANQLRAILKDREDEITRLRAAEKKLETIETATIERCAQVAENFEDGRPYWNSRLAAVIRALKDKPQGPAGDRGQVGWMGGEGP